MSIYKSKILRDLEIWTEVEDFKYKPNNDGNPIPYKVAITTELKTKPKDELSNEDLLSLVLGELGIKDEDIFHRTIDFKKNEVQAQDEQSDAIAWEEMKPDELNTLQTGYNKGIKIKITQEHSELKFLVINIPTKDNVGEEGKPWIYGIKTESVLNYRKFSTLHFRVEDLVDIENSPDLKDTEVDIIANSEDQYYINIHLNWLSNRHLNLHTVMGQLIELPRCTGIIERKGDRSHTIDIEDSIRIAQYENPKEVIITFTASPIVFKLLKPLESNKINYMIKSQQK